jgi:single-stranded-DNA-specific exonuclease
VTEDGVSGGIHAGDSGDGGGDGAGVPETVWRVREPDPAAVEAVADALGLRPMTALALVNRGVADPEDARVFLDPDLACLHDPFRLPDMTKAVDRLCRALDSGEKIFLHGDYDADGVTSISLLYRAFLILKADVVPYVPSRGGGYDLQRAGVDRAKEAGASLILTADCGTCAHDAINYAVSLGLDVIVTDHHRPEPTLPPAVAIVNPYREDAEETPPFRDLCGAGMAFKLMDALFARRQPELRAAFRERFTDLAALGTVADVSTLGGENRILVANGLRSLNEPRKPGVVALVNSLRLRRVDARAIAVNIGPHLNAAGRMGDAEIALRLLIARTDAEAAEVAREMEALRTRAREESDRVTKEALLEAIQPENQGRRVLVLARKRWGKGVVGVAAARVAEYTRRPTVLLSYNDESNSYSGSARTWGGFHILTALKACESLLLRCGGHRASAGLSLKAENLEAFREMVHAVTEGQISDVPEAPTLEVDAEVTDGNVWSFEQVTELSRLEPFGVGNPEPLFVTRGAFATAVRWVGKEQGTLQAWFRLPGCTHAVKCVVFRGTFAEDSSAGRLVRKMQPGNYYDIAYAPKINEWEGRASVEITLKDLRLSE